MRRALILDGGRFFGNRRVYQAARMLRAKDIAVSDAERYPEYAPDYAALFFADPDGLRLEITNYRFERRQRHDNWDAIGRT